jgi:hypothetical protein
LIRLQSVRAPYYLGWLDAAAKGFDKHTHLPILDAPPKDAQDLHSQAAVFLGSMMVSDVTQRLKRKNLPVRALAQEADTSSRVEILNCSVPLVVFEVPMPSFEAKGPL